MSAEENVAIASRFIAEQDRRKGPPPDELSSSTARGTRSWSSTVRDRRSPRSSSGAECRSLSWTVDG